MSWSNNDVLKSHWDGDNETIEQALANLKAAKTQASLPAHLVVSLVAMSLWSKDSMRDVLKNLIDGLE